MKNKGAKTKIVCTVNPNTADRVFLEKLIDQGMDVVRLNFSHMDPEDGEGVIDLVRAIRDERSIPIAIMLDTKGPEVRVFGYPESIELNSGDVLEISSFAGPNIEDFVSESPRHLYTNLANIGELAKGFKKALLMDGYIEAEIVEASAETIKIQLSNSGNLRPRAHLTVPGMDYPLPFLSEKDIRDIRFAAQKGLEYIALSFVRSAEDLFKVRNLIRDVKEDSQIRLIAKIESKQAINQLDEIVRYADGIMVARGDLGVELALEEVPVIQKKIIEKCYQSGKPVITATQMLESMIHNRVPTRAEASDVANACYDLTSAVMLSGETAIGKYPDLVVQTMERIIRKVEEHYDYSVNFYHRRDEGRDNDLTTIICYNAVTTAYQCQAGAIICFTKSGYSARQISRLRPGLPIYAFTPDHNVYHQLALNWGVFPYYVQEVDDFEMMLKNALLQCVKDGLVKRNELVVIVAGLPLGVRGRTNMIRVETAGKSRIPVKFLQSGSVTAQAVHLGTEDDLKKKDFTGKIVILRTFRDEWTSSLRYAAAIVAENCSFERQLQLLGMAYNIPVAINANAVCEIIAEGAMIELNSNDNLLSEI